MKRILLASAIAIGMVALIVAVNIGVDLLLRNLIGKIALTAVAVFLTVVISWELSRDE